MQFIFASFRTKLFVVALSIDFLVWVFLAAGSVSNLDSLIPDLDPAF
jgi:hypothetical protein